MSNTQYLLYIISMAGVTYLLRMLPMTLIKRKIRSRFVQSFIYYVPYAVLTAMTLPSILYCTEDMLPSLLGFAAAIAAALLGGSLLCVALSACGVVLCAQIVMYFLVLL